MTLIDENNEALEREGSAAEYRDLQARMMARDAELNNLAQQLNAAIERPTDPSKVQADIERRNACHAELRVLEAQHRRIARAEMRARAREAIRDAQQLRDDLAEAVEAAERAQAEAEAALQRAQAMGNRILEARKAVQHAHAGGLEGRDTVHAEPQVAQRLEDLLRRPYEWTGSKVPQGSTVARLCGAPKVAVHYSG